MSDFRVTPSFPRWRAALIEFGPSKNLESSEHGVINVTIGKSGENLRYANRDEVETIFLVLVLFMQSC